MLSQSCHFACIRTANYTLRRSLLLRCVLCLHIGKELLHFMKFCLS